MTKWIHKNGENKTKYKYLPLDRYIIMLYTLYKINIFMNVSTWRNNSQKQWTQIKAVRVWCYNKKKCMRLFYDYFPFIILLDFSFKFMIKTFRSFFMWIVIYKSFIKVYQCPCSSFYEMILGCSSSSPSSPCWAMFK